MPDPTTPNKQLYQPARGADVGTWDTPVNANWGVIDNSFGGVSTIQLSNASVTLSQAQYQNAFLVFTSTVAGGLAANVTITMPNIGSFYTVQNLTTNTSAFNVTLATTVLGGQQIALPWGEAVEIFTDGTNVKFVGLGRVGEYWDYAGSSVPSWVTACTVPPYLNCDGTAFSSATYPVLATILGGTTLPDSRGSYRATLNQGTARITSGTSTGGVDGNTLLSRGGSQTVTLSSRNMPPIPLTDPGHQHDLTESITNLAAGSGAGLQYQSSIGRKTAIATTGITGGSTSPTNFSVLPPTYVGGITMVRAG